MLSKKEIDKIEQLCDFYDIGDYHINDDGTLDVYGSVEIAPSNLTSLPLLFNKVSGDFECNHNRLTSLVGCPKIVGGSFYCSFNNLRSLEFSPSEVGGHFSCYSNKLTSLEFCPKKVGGSFICMGNELTSLIYFPSDIIIRSSSIDSNSLPRVFVELLKDNFFIERIDVFEDAYDEGYFTFIKYMNYYDVWTPEFNEANANALIAEIRDGLK